MLLVHLLLLISAASALKVTLIDGNAETTIEIEFNKKKNLKLAREKLISNGSIGVRNKTHDWSIWKNNSPIDVGAEIFISVEIIAPGDEPIIFRNVKNIIDALNIQIGANEIQTIRINWNEKLSKLREQLNKKGFLGSLSENCVQWKFLIRDREYVSDESQWTIAQHLENIKETNQLQMTDIYAQDSSIELYVYAGLESVTLPKISPAMNLFRLHSTLSGAGTCHGMKYNLLNNDWLALKKTTSLVDLKAANTDLQIPLDLIFTPEEAKFSTVRNATFKSRSGVYGIEFVSKTSKNRNIIGEVVTQYSRSHSPKVSVRIEKNTYCPQNCNEGVILDPVMLDNVQATSAAVVFMSRVVVCQAGTALRFTIDTEPRTPFWIKVKNDISQEVYVDTRGDHGQQSYWNKGYQNIVAESHVITEEADLLKTGYMPTFVVEVFQLLKPPQRRRRAAGDTITLPKEATNDGDMVARGAAHTGSGSDFGYKPGKLLMEVRFMLLTFKDAQTAQEIMGRGVSRFQTGLP